MESNFISKGKICNEKPSSIFKISNLKNQAASESSLVPAFGGAIPSHISIANIGISVEPTAQIDALTPAATTKATDTSEFVQFTEKMLQNFYNYASSFSKDAPDGQYVPLTTLTNWYDTFKRRLSNNPSFWKQ